MGKKESNKKIFFWIGIAIFVFIGILSNNDNPSNNTNNKRFSTAYLNVRKGPGTNFKKIDELNPGQKFTVVADSNDWIQIENTSANIYGWVARKYTKPKFEYGNWKNKQEQKEERQKEKVKEQKRLNRENRKHHTYLMAYSKVKKFVTKLKKAGAIKKIQLDIHKVYFNEYDWENVMNVDDKKHALYLLSLYIGHFKNNGDPTFVNIHSYRNDQELGSYNSITGTSIDK